MKKSHERFTTDGVWIPEGYPPLLASIALDIASSVRERLPETPSDVVFEIALSASEFVRAKHGGANVYIPSGYFFDCSEKDKAIWREYTGRNIRELAHKYKRSVVQIRSIVAGMRAQDMKRRQPSLLA